MYARAGRMFVAASAGKVGDQARALLTAGIRPGVAVARTVV